MKKKLITLLLIMVACASAVSAQDRKLLRINEVMVQNDSSFVDDYGCRSAWIELFNANFAPLQIANVYLTNNPAVKDKSLSAQDRKKMMYAVPLGDVNTKIAKRQHVVFWADDQPTRGTFHTNFVLVPGQENWIGLYDANGVDLIDEVTIPATLASNTTWARAKDGEGESSDPETWEVRDNLTDSTYVTPSSNNVIKDSNSKVEKFESKDPHGFMLTIMAMMIVFSALLLLCICFYVISKIGAYVSKHNKAKSHGASLRELPKEEHPEHDSGETIAAIVMALHEHLDTHDQENTILTINKVKRAYSPWSSKIYGLRETPRR